MTSAGSAFMRVTGTPRMPRWTYLIRQTTTLRQHTERWSGMAPGDPGDSHLRSLLADPARTAPDPAAQSQVGGVPQGTTSSIGSTWGRTRGSGRPGPGRLPSGTLDG